MADYKVSPMRLITAEETIALKRQMESLKAQMYEMPLMSYTSVIAPATGYYTIGSSNKSWAPEYSMAASVPFAAYIPTPKSTPRSPQEEEQVATVHVFLSNRFEKDKQRMGCYADTLKGLNEILEDAGLADKDCPVPTLPKVKALDSESEEDHKKRCDELWAPMRAFRSPDPRKIPVAKLNPGKGWIFTKDECALMVDTLEMWYARISDGDPNPTSVSLERVRKFLNFATVCAEGDGCNLM